MMLALNYKKLLSADPTVYAEFTNKVGQKIQLVEHPYLGDAHPVLVLFPEHQKAFESEFYDTHDLIGSDEYFDYQPVLDTETMECFYYWESEEV